MNSTELAFYLLGLMGDITYDEALRAIKAYTNLEEDKIKKILSEVIAFNHKFTKQFR